MSGMNLEGEGRATTLAFQLAIKKDLYPNYGFNSPKAVIFYTF